jgi:hypothetical protein
MKPQAAERLKAKLDEATRCDAPVELKFVMPDQWSVRLFIALCRQRPWPFARSFRTRRLAGEGLRVVTARA